jgi:hypothetical protein
MEYHFCSREITREKVLMPVTAPENWNSNTLPGFRAVLSVGKITLVDDIMEGIAKAGNILQKVAGGHSF